MRHKLAYRNLNRTSEHRKALFKNMLNSLIKYEQITTTLPKAKELKPKIDKVITLGKKNNLQTKKSLFSQLQDKSSVDKIVKTLSQRYVKRSGGFSRVIKAGFRYGDDAPKAIIELDHLLLVPKKQITLAAQKYYSLEGGVNKYKKVYQELI